MNELAIHIRNLSKTYHYNPKMNQNFRERLMDSHRIPSSKDIYALRDINFDIEKGSVLGIIGDNGSGKSTLLKLISGITQPTKGFIEIEGRVASILEVGTGFHPDLSGRENIFLSGTLMGMSKSEVASKFNTIVDFSEISEYIDLSVKHYSSGMFMRLAFSVVAHLNTDIVLLDEVFSVGDFTFRNKSLDKVLEMSKSDRTLILVSHDLTSLERTCDYILELEDGRMSNYGKTSDVIGNYIENKIISAIADDVDEDAAVPKTEEGQNGSPSIGTEEDQPLVLQNKENEEPTLDSEEKGHVAISVKDGAVITNKVVSVEKSVTSNKVLGIVRVENDSLNEMKNPEKVLPKNFSSSRTWKKGVSDKDRHITVYKLTCKGNVNKAPIFAYEDKLTLQCEFDKQIDGRVALAFMIFHNLKNEVFVSYSGYSSNKVDLDRMTPKGRYIAECIVPPQLFNKGIYSISIFFVDQDLKEIFGLHNKIFFKIKPKENISELHMDNDHYMGPLKPSFRWDVQSVK